MSSSLDKISKPPEFLLAAEILELFIADCLVPSQSKATPFSLLEQLLSAYCEYLAVRTPSGKHLGAALTQRFPKRSVGTSIAYQVGIKPSIISKEGNTQ